MKHVLYHGNCYDGFGAAWAAWKALGHDGVVYRACTYDEGDRPLDHTYSGDHVYVLDFSFSRRALETARRWLNKLLVLDHHKTAEEELRGLPCVKFDLNKSGAMLAWEYFHPGKEPPALLRYIQDRDLWRFDLADTKAVHALLLATPFNFEEFEKLAVSLETDFPLMVTSGEAMLCMQRAQVQKICDKAVQVLIAGHKVPACNTCMHFSEVPEELLKRHPEAPFAAYWYDVPASADQLTRQWGLRSRTGFDVSAIAKQLGGGGHAAAAGFHSSPGWWPALPGAKTAAERLSDIYTSATSLDNNPKAGL